MDEIKRIAERIEELEVKAIPRYKGGVFGDYEGMDFYIDKNAVMEIIESEAALERSENEAD